VNLHHRDAHQEIAIADGVGHEIVGARAETAHASPRTRHFDALERARGVTDRVVAQIDIIKLLAWKAGAHIAQHAAQRAAITGKFVGAPVKCHGVRPRSVL